MAKQRSKLETLLDFSNRAMRVFGTSKITKQQAVDAGLVFYWPGEPCERGHLTYRYVKSNMCRQCQADLNEARNYGATQPTQKARTTKRSLDDLRYKAELAKLTTTDDYPENEK